MDNTATPEEHLSKSKQKSYCVDNEKQNNGLIVLEYGNMRPTPNKQHPTKEPQVFQVICNNLLRL